MARPKLIPDLLVHDCILRLLAEGGERAVGFAQVGRAMGLAGPTLVQRFGSREAMVRGALAAGWDRLDAATEAAEADAALTPRGAQALLKTLGGAMEPALMLPHLRDAALRERAEAWRLRLERALALRLGGGERGHQAAAMLFAAWQGQLLWMEAGGKGFRLRDATRRLAPKG